jgi:hypothetical protein
MAKTGNKLTAAQLKKLEVGQSAYGSNLRVTKNKSGLTFHACFAIDGERYLHKVGTDEATKFALNNAFRQRRRSDTCDRGCRLQPKCQR